MFGKCPWGHHVRGWCCAGPGTEPDASCESLPNHHILSFCDCEKEECKLK